jgi:predicted phosphodiesterase
MRYAIFSDIHSNLEAFNSVLEACKKESVDRYLCIGDVVGYASNPTECIDLVRDAAVVCVAGNHDWAAVNLFSADYFNKEAREAIFWTRRNLDEERRNFLGSLQLVFKNEHLIIAHGSLNSPEEFNYTTDVHAAQESFMLMESNICFIGHTHVPGVFIQDKFGGLSYRSDCDINIKELEKYIVNVGSVGQPRDNNPKASYCIFDTEKKEVRIKRAVYDIEAAREKIINARLPVSLGDRLLSGR